MRYWNIHDAALLKRLAEIAGEDGHVFSGFEGGVAVYKAQAFLGLWVEMERERFSFIPAGMQDASLSGCTLDQAVVATRTILAATRSKRRSRPGR